MKIKVLVEAILLSCLTLFTNNRIAGNGIPCVLKAGLCGCVFVDKYNGYKSMQISLSSLDRKDGSA